jgi:hypothetical protein
MEYGKALKIGRTRAEEAAETIRRWTGIKACAVCAVKPACGRNPGTTRAWVPVGQESWKEIARDDGIRGRGNYHLLVVDKNGEVKACSLERFPLGEVLRMADRLPMRVAKPGEGELWKCLDEEDRRIEAKYHALHAEV